MIDQARALLDELHSAGRIEYNEYTLLWEAFDDIEDALNIARKSRDQIRNELTAERDTALAAVRKTGVFATDHTEVMEGDRIEVILPARSIYSPLTLARGVVFFETGSFKVRRECGVGDTPRLDDFAPERIINILKEEANT